MAITYDTRLSDCNAFGTVHGGVLLRLACQSAASVVSAGACLAQVSRFDFLHPVLPDTSLSAHAFASDDGLSVRVELTGDKKAMAQGVFLYRY